MLHNDEPTHGQLRAAIHRFEPVDEYSTRKLLESSLNEMARLLPPNARVSVLMNGAQKSKYDCPIFALQSASKMVDERGFLDALHVENAAGGGGAMSPLPSQQVGPYRIVDASTITPPAFYKHAQSTKVVKAAFSGRKEALAVPVNKDGETLLERLEANRDFRLDFNSEVSTSIEDKRILYLERARDYLMHAPEHEVNELTEASAHAAPEWFKRSREAVDEGRGS